MVSTGDMQNNLRILQSVARHLKYPNEVDYEGLNSGNPTALLPLYNYTFMLFNVHFTEEVLDFLGDGLCTKSDVRFMECVYRMLRDMFGFKPPLTKKQFFTVNAFAERKVMMCVDVMRLVQEHCRYVGSSKLTSRKVSVPVASVRHHKIGGRGEAAKDTVDLLDLSCRSPDPVRRHKSVMGVSNGWQMKQGYMRPASEACSLKRYKSCDQVYRGDTSPTASQKCASGSQPAGAVPGPDGAGLSQTSNGRAGVCDRRHVDDPSSVAPPAEGAGNMQNICRSERTQESERLEKSQYEAVEHILSKVRALPAQLTAFMTAVDSRLVKIESRLDRLEAITDSKRSSAKDVHVDVDDRHAKDIGEVKAKLTLMDNRMVLLESRIKVVRLPRDDGGKPEERKVHCQTSPFDTYERGGGLPPQLTQRSFPVAQDVSVCGVANDGRRVCVSNGGEQALVGCFSRLSAAGGGNGVVESVSDDHHTVSTSPEASEDGDGESDALEVGECESAGLDSLDYLDTSTVQRVSRINDLLQTTTRQLLPASSSGAG